MSSAEAWKMGSTVTVVELMPFTVSGTAFFTAGGAAGLADEGVGVAVPLTGVDVPLMWMSLLWVAMMSPGRVESLVSIAD
jgi:hypothetical protein